MVLEQLLPGAWASSFVVKLLIAGVLGAAIGLEREMHGRDAGLRTNMLVSVGAALFTVVSLGIVSSESAWGDPGRIAAQIVTGIGFLGAVAIIKGGFTIRGLTTAASLWIVAGIGMAVGAGYFDAALLATAIAIAALLFLSRLHHVVAHASYYQLEVIVGLSRDAAEVIEAVKQRAAAQRGVDVQDISIERDNIADSLRLICHLRLFQSGKIEQTALDVLQQIEDSVPAVHKVRWSQR